MIRWSWQRISRPNLSFSSSSFSSSWFADRRHRPVASSFWPISFWIASGALERRSSFPVGRMRPLARAWASQPIRKWMQPTWTAARRDEWIRPSIGSKKRRLAKEFQTFDSISWVLWAAGDDSSCVSSWNGPPISRRSARNCLRSIRWHPAESFRLSMDSASYGRSVNGPKREQ